MHNSTRVACSMRGNLPRGPLAGSAALMRTANALYALRWYWNSTNHLLVIGDLWLAAHHDGSGAVIDSFPAGLHQQLAGKLRIQALSGLPSVPKPGLAASNCAMPMDSRAGLSR